MTARATPAKEGDRIYILRRADGDPVGEYQHWVVDDPGDWTPAEIDTWDPVEWEMLTCTVQAVSRRIIKHPLHGGN